MIANRREFLFALVSVDSRLKIPFGLRLVRVEFMNNNSHPGKGIYKSPIWANLFKKKPDDDEESVLSTLRLVPLFSDMSDSELREFEKIIHRRAFKANETIFWEGEPGVGMYIIQRGAVTIFKHAAGEEREELALLRDGEFFGELALLDESPRSATAVAKTPSEIIGLFRPDLFELLERKPRLGNKFLFQLALIVGERLKNTNAEMQTLRAQLDKSEIIV
jgi:signal-transduction protein with cAMP-binding, CBS, and nucleotidyltransferase domain